jgi:hypothetical protein
MTKGTVLETHRGVFYQALLTRDWNALLELYADDYTLVRSNGTVLSKQAVLSDLRTGGLVFISIELTKEQIQIDGSFAILTGESRTIAERGGVSYESRFRLIAVYVEVEGIVRLRYFQSTDIAPADQSDNLHGIEAKREGLLP